MERVCRVCGRVYRGLVCQACHPRRKGQGAKGDGRNGYHEPAGADTEAHAEPQGAQTGRGPAPAGEGQGAGAKE